MSDMAASQRFCLKWNNFQKSVTSVFETLRQDGELVDITLCCEGQKIKAHRMMLSASSPYFKDLLKENPCQHPVFFLKDTSFADLAAVIEFVYKGEVNVLQSQLGSFLKTAEMLQVKGLSGDDDDEQQPQTSSGPPPSTSRVPQEGASPQRFRPVAPVSLPGTVLPSPSGRRVREPPDTPGSPRAKRRRASGSGSRSGSPSQQQQSAVSLEPAGEPAAGPDPGLPPIPTAPATSAANTAQPEYNVKVEKIDIADDDDESLEATLGQVTSYEASQFEGGSDQSTSSHDMAGILGGMRGDGGDMGMAGTSEDGSSQAQYECDCCGAIYKHLYSFRSHQQMHAGKTKCQHCGRVFSRPTLLNLHLYRDHGIKSAYTPRSAKRVS